MQFVSFPATVRIEFDWLDDGPRRVNYELLRIEKYLENTQALTEAAKEIARVEMATRFEREVDPEGSPWQELARPAENQVGILRLSTDMYKKAISEDAWTATPVGVFFDTNTLPKYWPYHEQPDGGAQRLPRRSFIGLSEHAEDQIEAMGDLWLAGGISGSGRGLAGRFVPLS